MELIEIKNKEQLNDFVGQQEQSQFLQSWQWGEFQRAAGGQVFRIGIMDDGKFLVTATLIKKNLGLGQSYFYCPRGPIFKNNEIDLVAHDLLVAEIKNLSQKQGAIFYRLEPGQEINFLKAERTIDIQPSKTLVLELAKIEEQLLAEMHQKTRYNIRLAQKKGVEISVGKEKDFADFWQLMSQTSDRDAFRVHDREYYQKMLSIDNHFIKLFCARYQGKLLAASIVSFFGDTVTYMHGASSNEQRELMAPYALQWQVIKIAQEAGYKYYDFYGIDEKKWPGVTRFKLGFGGREINYPGTFDVALNSFYGLYKVARWIRRRM